MNRLPASGPRGHTTNLNTGIFIAPVIFDFFVTVLTLLEAARLRREGFRSNLAHIFVREGLIYFVVLTTLNIGKLDTFFKACDCTDVPFRQCKVNLGEPRLEIPESSANLIAVRF